MPDTSFCFTPGKLTAILDGGAGSSGKGKLGSFITEYADNWQFCCNTFSAQAGHWVKLDDGREFFYQTFNSCAYQDSYEKMYIGPGSCLELPAVFREIEESNINPSKIGIHPLASIIQGYDMAFERGEVDFHGVPRGSVDGTMKTGSTCHGVGACKARKVLRRPEVVLAKDVPELSEFLCNTSEEIMARLDAGQAGLLEIAQGFQLSLLHIDMYPYVTSRNVTVAAGMDDLMVPIFYAGDVILNFRTYPIRINSKKYRDPKTKRHLVWEEIEQYKAEGKEIDIYEGDSGPGYDDQEEISWEELTERSGSPDPIMEITSVTKLPRRAFTFSHQNLEEAIRYNKTHGNTYVSVNFADYVDHSVSGQRGGSPTSKLTEWLMMNITPVISRQASRAELSFIGTGPLTDDTITL